VKRFGFLAVMGSAALAAGFTVSPAALARPTVRLRVLETDWMMSQSHAIWYKRYFVMNAVKGKSVPHVADAMTMSFEEWFSPGREQVQKSLDEIAHASLKSFIEKNDVLSPNVVFFRQNDALPTSLTRRA
jgi:hypothetical protein